MQRGWMSDPDFADEKFTEREAFQYLIENAAWKDRNFRVKNKVCKLQRGQLTASYRFLAMAWKWKKDKVDNFLNIMRDVGKIQTDNQTGQTVITICNYSKYQDVSPKDQTDQQTEARQFADSLPTERRQFADKTNQDNQDNQVKDTNKLVSKKTAEKKPVKIPEKKGKPHAKPKRNTSIKTEFGEDQRMPEKYRPVAAEKGLHESWHNFEWGLFCDYWLGKGEGRVDWTATWRGWSARAVNWDERKGSDKNTPSDRASGSATLDAVNELMARRSDQKRQSLRDGEAGF